MTEELGKDPKGVRKYSPRTKPAIVIVNGKAVLEGGRWNDAAMADYIIENGHSDWITVGELAKVGRGSNTISNKTHARSRLSSIFVELRGRGMFLAIEYHDKNGAASAVKIADPKSEQDRQNVMDKLMRMKKRKEMSEDQYEKSIALLHALIC